jgi:predicted amidohydrolase
MATPESVRWLKVEALSCPSPETSEQLANLLDEHLTPIRNRSLIVLPEYLIHGEKLFDGKNPYGDPMVITLINYARSRGAHIVAGMVEESYPGEKYVTGLFVSPDGLIEKQRKQTPTSFEKSSGILPGIERTKSFNFRGLGCTLSIAMCIESFRLDKELRSLESEILVNPRGFDLDDPKYGTLSESWLSHNQDLARMGKRYVAGSTGNTGKGGALAEIIDFEGQVMVSTLKSREPASAILDLDLLQKYRRGEYKSTLVPHF